MTIERRLPNSRVKYVTSFDELVTTRLAVGINALCWPRVLDGDFEAIVRALGDRPGVTQLDGEEFAELRLSAAGKRAAEHMLEDVRLLQERGLAPELNYIREYPRDDARAVVATDVYSFHVDRSPVEVDTWLCTYHGAPSEGLPNEHAAARVEDATTRATLLREFGGEDNAAFREFLRENHYDLHYAPAFDAQPWSFGVGNLWRVATAWPGSLVLPCIHRAPPDIIGQGRLLLIS